VRLLLRLLSAVLTIVSAFLFVVVVRTATDGSTIKVVGFTAFAVGAVVALVAALTLWARTSK